jgi:hypothetical protein
MKDVSVVNKKSFWSKPEGMIGMIGAFAAAGLALWFLSWFVPFMLMLGLSTAGMIAVWVPILFVGYTAFTKNTLRNAIVLRYQQYCRNLHYTVVKYDPIGIRRGIQSEAKKRREEFQELKIPVKTAKLTLCRTADELQSMLEDLQAQYNLHVKDSEEEEANEILAQIGQVQKELENVRAFAQETVVMDQALDAAEKKIDKIIKKADFEINLMAKKMKAAESISTAWSKLRKIFSPPSDEEQLRLDAERASEENLNEDLGRIDQYMTEFKGVLADMNTKDRVNAEKARIKMQGLKEFTSDIPALAMSQPVVLRSSLNSVHQPVQTKRF